MKNNKRIHDDRIRKLKVKQVLVRQKRQLLKIKRDLSAYVKALCKVLKRSLKKLKKRNINLIARFQTKKSSYTSRKGSFMITCTTRKKKMMQ